MHVRWYESRMLYMLQLLLRSCDSAVLDPTNPFSMTLQVLQSEKVMNKFQELTVRLEHALNLVSYDRLDIPDELREQVIIHFGSFSCMPK